jgi:hypothetical protein
MLKTQKQQEILQPQEEKNKSSNTSMFSRPLLLEIKVFEKCKSRNMSIIENTAHEIYDTREYCVQPMETLIRINRTPT